MDPIITNQPIGGCDKTEETSGNLEGLEKLAQMKELKVKQRHPGCLECKFFDRELWYILLAFFPHFTLWSQRTLSYPYVFQPIFFLF